MTTMASQITSLMVVYSTVHSDADQRKRQSSASLAFVRGIHRDRWIPRIKGQLRGKCFHLVSSSCTHPIKIALISTKDWMTNAAHYIFKCISRTSIVYLFKFILIYSSILAMNQHRSKAWHRTVNEPLLELNTIQSTGTYIQHWAA